MILIILSINDYYIVASIYFYYLLFSLTFEIIKVKRIFLIHVWNGAFIFIILSEVFLPYFVPYGKIDVIKYLIISNIVVNIGYNISSFNFKVKERKNYLLKKRSKLSPIILLVLVVAYFILKIQDAIFSFSVGRNTAIENNDEANLFTTIFINPLGLILPAIIVYYFYVYKKNKWYIPLILSLPIFIVLFLEGTRFTLLFSLIGFALVLLSQTIKSKVTFKTYVLIVFACFSLVISSNLMKHLRSSVTKDESFNILIEEENKDLQSLMVPYMSPEGVVDMTDLSFKYFKNHEHLYGESSSFILYFWIPRSIWPDKPTMLGYWLIRKYRSGFGDEHSSSFGFTGDFYADFGMFSFFFIFLLGYFVKILEAFKDQAFRDGGYNIIIAALLYSYVFFFVRSPITSSMNFMGILFFYFFLRAVLFKKTTIKLLK